MIIFFKLRDSLNDKSRIFNSYEKKKREIEESTQKEIEENYKAEKQG
jgi:hypothetical protein